MLSCRRTPIFGDLIVQNETSANQIYPQFADYDEHEREVVT
jgi:hypothetical protein